MPTIGDNNIRVVQLSGGPSGGGPYTIVETPISSGNYAVTDIGGFSFIIPAPIKAQTILGAFAFNHPYTVSGYNRVVLSATGTIEVKGQIFGTQATAPSFIGINRLTAMRVF